jgi:hypothetical protein
MLLRSCLLKHIIEGNVERGIDVRGIQGRRSRQLLDYLMETREYCK